MVFFYQIILTLLTATVTISAPDNLIALAHSVIFLYLPVPTIKSGIKFFISYINLSFFNLTTSNKMNNFYFIIFFNFILFNFFYLIFLDLIQLLLF